MRRARILTLAIAITATALTAALPAAAQDSGASALKFGWAQDPETLNPFVGYNEEDFTIWGINYDLLVNFDPEDLSPTPGIAESWEVSEDQKTVTFHLVKGAKWSDGEPITSEDVKWSLEVLGSRGLYFTSYTDNVTAIKTPDKNTVVIETSRPDARIVGGLFIYILPEHIWGEVPVKDLEASYKPELPLVGSGPYTATEYEKGRILTMERNPEWRGEEPAYDELQFIKYGSNDAVERALSLGEVDIITEVQPATFKRLGEQEGIEVLRAPTAAFTQLAFNLCSEKDCPDAQFNPAVQDRDVRQAIAYGIDRERLNAIATQGTSFVAQGLLPAFYKGFFETPELAYPYDPEMANQILDDAGWAPGEGGVREKDGERLSFDLYVRSESPFTVQMAKLIAEQTQEIGVEFNVQVVSSDKLGELTTREEDGKPAPDFDTFIWGWGGDPYDPSFLLGLMTTGEIGVGRSSDSFYSNPKYDRLFEEQASLFDVEERKALIQEMIALLQRDLPYIVLTEDPRLEAYRTDAVANVTPACPADEGNIFCQQVSYEPLLSLAPAEGSTEATSTGIPGGLVAIGAVMVAVAAFLFGRARGRRIAEPLELEA
jgi:peptide/nickel transport system substrate-binding protein